MTSAKKNRHQARVVVIDNYDSFTYNLVQYLGQLGAELEVFRNDAVTLDRIASLKPSHLLISPGPGRPRDGGISLDSVKRFAGEIPILGVCLGLQVICEACGGRIVHAPELKHGKTSMIHHDGRNLFAGIPSPFEATRYHSLVAERDSLPACLEISAWTEDQVIMGLRHRELPLEGVQFHPESVLTKVGMPILERFLCSPKSPA